MTRAHGSAGSGNRAASGGGDSSLAPHELTSAEAWRALLGTKVSLRFRLHDDPSHPFSEAVGMVQSVRLGDDGTTRLTVVNRRGQVSSVALEDILAAKAF
ncbi:MAG: hypothetical protein ACRDJV_06640 [Actinomycetota bacterium]